MRCNGRIQEHQIGVSVCSVGRAVAAGVIDAKTGSMRRGTTGRVSWRLGGAGAESESERSRSTECEARRTGEKEEKKRGKKRKKEKKKTGKKQVGGCRGRSTRRTESGGGACDSGRGGVSGDSVWGRSTHGRSTREVCLAGGRRDGGGWRPGRSTRRT